MDTKNLAVAGSVKVAILIQSMDEDKAQEIFAKLSLSERELVKNHLSHMGTISQEVVERWQVSLHF